MGNPLYAERYKEKNRMSAAAALERRRSDPEYREECNRKQREYLANLSPEAKMKRREAERLRRERDRDVRNAKRRTPEGKRQRAVRRWRKQGIDITLEGYDRMLRQQSNRCLLCRKQFDGEVVRACLDHCHDCGSARGILCNPCNFMLGFYEAHDHTSVWNIEEVNEYVALCGCE